MNKIVPCKYCNRYEYYGKMTWLNGRCLCRSCYKEMYKDQYHREYEYSDKDGMQPTLKEYLDQES